MISTPVSFFFFNFHFSCSPWQGPSRHGLTASGFSPLHWSPIRHVTRRRSIPSPQVTEHCGGVQTSTNKDECATCLASNRLTKCTKHLDVIMLQQWRAIIIHTVDSNILNGGNVSINMLWFQLILKVLFSHIEKLRSMSPTQTQHT